MDFMSITLTTQLSQMLPTKFKEMKDIHNLNEANGVFLSVACRYNFQERVRGPNLVPVINVTGHQ